MKAVAVCALTNHDRHAAPKASKALSNRPVHVSAVIEPLLYATAQTSIVPGRTLASVSALPIGLQPAARRHAVHFNCTHPATPGAVARHAGSDVAAAGLSMLLFTFVKLGSEMREPGA